MSPGYRLTAKRLWAAVVIAGVGAGAGISPVAASSTSVSHPARPSISRTFVDHPYVSTAKQWSLAQTQSTGAVKVTWSGIHGAAGYDIYRSTAAGTQGAKVNKAPVRGQLYMDRTAQKGTTYYYTVVALSWAAPSKGQLAPNLLTQQVTFAQVQASAAPKPGAATAKPQSLKTARGSSGLFAKPAATGTKTAAIKTKRVATPKSAVSSACVVALPHDVTGNETNFGCGSASTIVLWPNLSYGGRNPDIAPSRATCPDNTSANTDCDVHIKAGAVETITPGTSVYVWAGQAEDVAPAPDSSDPTQGADIIVAPLGSLKSSGNANSGQQILFDSVNALLGAAAPGAPAPGDWGDIAYQGTSVYPAVGSFDYTSMKNGNQFAVNGAPLAMSHDNFVNEAGNEPLDSSQWIDTTSSSVFEVTDQANATPTLDSLHVVINSASFSEGICIFQFSALGNTLAPTISNSSVTGAAIAYDIQGWNDLSSGAVTQNLTAHLLGDTSSNSSDGAYVAAQWFGSAANAGDDNVVLDIQNSNLAGSTQPFTGGLVVFSRSDKGSGSLGGQVLGSTLSGYVGAFTDASSDSSAGAGNAAETVTVSNSKIQGTNSGDPYYFPAWNVGDTQGDGPLSTSGSGSANVAPTFNNDTFTGPSGSLAAYGAAFGSGNSTVAPNVNGGSMSNAEDAYYVYSETDGTGTSTISGEMTGATLVASSGPAYRTSANSFGGGATTDDPTLSGDSLTSNDGPAYESTDGVWQVVAGAPTVSLPTSPVTTDPTITGSNLLGYDANVLETYTEQDFNGMLTSAPVINTSNLLATYWGDAMDVGGQTYSDTAGSAGQATVAPVLFSSLAQSQGGAVVDAWGYSGNSADLAVKPTVSGSNLKGVDSAFDGTAEGVSSYAEADGNGNAVSNALLNQGGAGQATRVVSTNSSLDDEAFAYGNGNATADPTVNQGTTLSNGANASDSYVYSETEGSGSSTSNPSFDHMVLDTEGLDTEAQNFGFYFGSGVAGDARSAGSFTNDTLIDTDNGAYYGYSFTIGQLASGDGASATTDPTFVNDLISSTASDGVYVEANGEGNPADPSSNGSGAYTAKANVQVSNIQAGGTGIFALADDLNTCCSTGFAGSASDYNAELDSMANNVNSYDSSFETVAQDNFTSGTAGTSQNLFNSNGTSRNGGAAANVATNQGSGPASDTSDYFSNGGQALDAANGPGFVSEAVGYNNAATTNVTWDGESAHSTEGITAIQFADANSGTSDTATYNVNMANVANSGGAGVEFINFSGGKTDSEINVAQLTETNLNNLGFGFLASGNADTGNVKLNHSTIANVGPTGGDNSAVVLEDTTPDASTPVVGWIQGNSISNVTGDGIDLFQVVPEVVGNNIWNANLGASTECFTSGAPCGAGVYVEGNPGTTHLIARRPVPNPTLNGIVSANYIHENRWGVWLEFDNGVNPDVQNNDFAGTLLSTNNPQDDLVVNNTLPVDASQNWWGSTDMSVSGDIDNSCYTAGTTTGSCLPPSNVTLTPLQTSPRTVSGYVVDKSGALWPYGGATNKPVTGYWPGQDVVRGIATRGDALGGYVLDDFGALHQFGDAPAVVASGYWPGWDIARGVALIPGTDHAGYTVDGWGGIHPFGGAPNVTATAYYPHWNVIRGIVVNPNSHQNPTCVSGYTMDAYGGIHPFADTTSAGCSLANIPSVPVTDPHWNFAIARAIGLQAYGEGYILDGYGALHEFGGASPALSSAYFPGMDVMRGFNVGTDGSGYSVDEHGGVHPFGPYAPPLPNPVSFSGDTVRGID